MKGATNLRCPKILTLTISIHAPREGSDRYDFTKTNSYEISIHAPREGSDKDNKMDGYAGDLFQSTLPVKGATIFRTKFQIIHVISIHAPREGSDHMS